MEGTSEEWEIQTYSAPSESYGKESGMLERGLRIGKKIVITGFVLSSAPLVLPPLMVFSAFGLAVSVPFGLYFVSYACTEGIMSKFFPMPKPPSDAPLMLEYGEEFPVEDESVDKDVGFGGGIDMEQEEKEYIQDTTKDSVEMKIELTKEIDKGEILEDDTVQRRIDFGKLEKEGADNDSVEEDGYEEDDEGLVDDGRRPQEDDDRNGERQGKEVLDTIEEDEPLDEGSRKEQSTKDVPNMLVSIQDGKESSENVDVEVDRDAQKIGYVDEYDNLKRETRDFIEKIRDKAHLENTMKENKPKVEEAPEDAESRDEWTDSSVDEIKRPTEDEILSTHVEDKHAEKRENSARHSIAGQGVPKLHDEIKRPVRDEVPRIMEDKLVQKKEDDMSAIAIEIASKSLGDNKTATRDEIPSALLEDKPVMKKEDISSSVAVHNAPKPLSDNKTAIRDKVPSALLEDKPVMKKVDISRSVAVHSAPKPLDDITVFPEGNSDGKHIIKEVPTEKTRETTPASDISKYKRKPKTGKKAGSEEDAKHNLGHDVNNEIHSSKKSEVTAPSNVVERKMAGGKKSALSGDRIVAGEQHTHRNGTSKDKQPPSALVSDKKVATTVHPVRAAASSTNNRVNPSNKALFSEEQIWHHIHALRTIVGYKETPQRTCIEELKALYIFTGVEPPVSFVIPSDLADISDKLHFLMAIVGVK